MWRVTLVLALMSLALAGAFVLYVGATGIGVPYPDPTPAQAANERHHHAIAGPLLLITGLAVLSCLACGLLAGILSIVRRRRA